LKTDGFQARLFSLQGKEQVLLCQISREDICLRD
jgi:hypothetical protein